MKSVIVTMASRALTFCVLISVVFSAVFVQAEVIYAGGQQREKITWGDEGIVNRPNRLVISQTNELKQCFAKITNTLTQLEAKNSDQSAEIKKIIDGYDTRVKKLEYQILTLTKEKQSAEDKLQKVNAETMVIVTEKESLEKRLKIVTAENLKLVQTKTSLESNVQDLRKSLFESQGKIFNSQVIPMTSCKKLRESDKVVCNENLKKVNEYKTKIEIELTSVKKGLQISEAQLTKCKSQRIQNDPPQQTQVVIPTKNQKLINCPRTPLEKELTTLPSGRYYFSRNKKLNWNSAKQFCVNNGMQLLSIETSTENQYINNQIKVLGLIKVAPQDEIWTSGSDANREGHWYWTSTNRAFGFKAWLPGEPNNHAKNQHCSAIAIQRGQINWDDFYCHVANRFICEMPPIPNGCK